MNISSLSANQSLAAAVSPAKKPAAAATAAKPEAASLDDLLKREKDLHTEIDAVGISKVDDKTKQDKTKELLDQLKQVEDQIAKMRGDGGQPAAAAKKTATPGKSGVIDITA